jgi:hypothetical protein
MDSLIKPKYESLIFEFRGFKVMVDSDLSVLYGIPTKRLKEQVKRNIKRFPVDFMFKLSKEEKNELVANCDRLKNLKHSSVNPLVFTEQGVAMLSSVLNSDKAIQVNIEIMRAFALYRTMLKENEELKKEIKKLDSKLNTAFKYLLEKLDALSEKKKRKRPLGFEIPKKNKN